MWLRKKRILELWWLMKNKTSGRLGQQWCITHTMANTSSQPITLQIFRSTDFDSEVSLENEQCGLKPAAPVRSSCIDDPLFRKVSSFFLWSKASARFSITSSFHSPWCFRQCSGNENLLGVFVEMSLQRRWHLLSWQLRGPSAHLVARSSSTTSASSCGSALMEYSTDFREVKVHSLEWKESVVQ